MSNERPPEVTASHRARKAIVYIRQSTARQVAENQGSTADQQGQVRFPRLWGWIARLIEIVADDLGLSGSTTIHRKGYLRIVAEIQAELVGAVFVSDLSRVGRDLLELLTFLTECKRHNVLLVVNGRIHDLRDSGAFFTQTIMSTVAQFESVRLRELMERGKIAKLLAGHAMSPPPRGYVRGAKGTWPLDPEPVVREGPTAVFREFPKARSMPRTVRILKAQGVKMLRRDANGALVSTEPNVVNVQAILHNPGYTGDLYYRRNPIDPSKGRTPSGDWRKRRALPDEVIVVPNHHEAYITHAEFDENQRILAMNAPTPTRRSPGSGSALLQSITRCACHPSRKMNPGYNHPDRNGQSSHIYVCMGDYMAGGQACMSVPGNHLDHAICRALHARLARPRLEIIQEVWKSEQNGVLSEQQLHLNALRRARQEVANARHNCLTVDKNKVLVKKEYESLWEEASQHLQQLEAAVPGASIVPTFTEELWADLLTLCGDFLTIFHAPTTTNRDRKEIIRTVIESVIIENRTREEIRARIVWVDGQPDTIVGVKLSPYAHRVINEMAQKGTASAEIARHLNAEGMLTLQRRPWSRETVTTWIGRFKKKGLNGHPRSGQ